MAGDGTTSVVVICGALLSKCVDLLGRGVHPTIISDAFGLASRKAVEVRLLCLHGAGEVCLVGRRSGWKACELAALSCTCSSHSNVECTAKLRSQEQLRKSVQAQPCRALTWHELRRSWSR